MVDETSATTTEVEVVAYGRGASDALARRIGAAKSVHPLDPVTVIVSSNMAGLSARRLLGGGVLGSPGLANVDFVTPFRLAEILGSARLASRQPLTTPVLAAAVRAALEAEPGMFAPVAEHQATHSAVIALYAELSRADPRTLARIAGASARGADVVALVRAIGDRLTGYYDEDGLAEAATARLRDDRSAVAALGVVVWFLPDRLSPAMAFLLREVLLAPASGVVVGVTGDVAADGPVRRACESAGIVVAVPEHDPVTVPHADRVLSVSDPDEEARAVVREVMAQAEAGTPLDRIAIFYPSPDPYARTLLEHLDGAGIPHNGPATARLADSAAGRTLLAVLDLPALGWGRGDVIALAAGAPLRHEERPVSPRQWDALSRSARVIGGLDDWSTKLAAHSDRLRAEIERPHGGEEEEAAARRRALTSGAEAARALLSFVERLAADVEELHRCRTWADRAASARGLLGRLLGAESLRRGWPEHEIIAAQHVDSALARLATLDEIEPSSSTGAFELAVKEELERTGRVGRFGEGVLVAPLASAVGLDLDAVFVVGMAEGTCPSFRREDALLPDDDRALAVVGELIDRDDRLLDQHRAFLAALAAAGVSRTLVFPRGDLRGRRGRLASRWLLDSASQLAGRRVFSSDMDGLGPPVVEKIASYSAGVAVSPVQGSRTDRDVAVLLNHVAAGGDAGRHPLVTGALGRGFVSLRARQGTAFTEWDGNLSGQDVPSPATGMLLSPSQLERWATCPFSYFLHQVLGLRERDDPEQIVEIAANDRGSLVHEVLETFLNEAITRPGGPPAPDEAWSDADRERMRELADAAFDRFQAEGRTGRPLTWRRTRTDILADLDAFLDEDATYRAKERVRPVQVEMEFGNGAEQPLTMVLPGGHELNFKGRIDRVDRAEDGHLVVLDYKTGKDRLTKQLEADPVRAGRSLQLGIYAEAARGRLGGGDVDARYWMATVKGEFKQPGYRWTEAERQRFLPVVETIVEGIEAGAFPAQPGPFTPFWDTHENCQYCPFDRVCPRDRDDQQRAKADAPELALLDRLQLPDPATDG